MVKIRSREELRTIARTRGMVNVAAGDAPKAVERNGAPHRVGADAMRDLGIAEDRIVAKYGYSPDPVAERGRDEGHVPRARGASARPDAGGGRD